MAQLIAVDHDPFADDAPPPYPLALAPNLVVSPNPMMADLDRQRSVIANAVGGALLPSLFGQPSAADVDRFNQVMSDVQRGKYRPGKIPTPDIGQFRTPASSVAAGVMDAAGLLPWGVGAKVAAVGAVPAARALAREGAQEAVPGVIRATEAAALPMDQAARMARAKEMGFRTNMPVAYGAAPANEKIATAALNVDGRIYTAPTHFDAMMQAERSLAKPFDDMQHGAIWDGFVTDRGRFVSRWEAADIAARNNQGATSGIFGATRGLASEDTKQAAPLRDWFTADQPGQQSFAQQLARRFGAPPAAPDIGATAPGLPGGHGVWGSLEPAAGQNTVPLWHRTEKLRVMDAQGLQDHDIQASLREAWERGHDAVMLRNYTRPGGQTPENVIVVRDPNQLRSPNAAFDIAKKNSANLLAGLAGLVAFPVGAHFLAPVDHDPFAQ